MHVTQSADPGPAFVARQPGDCPDNEGDDGDTARTCDAGQPPSPVIDDSTTHLPERGDASIARRVVRTHRIESPVETVV